MTRLVCGFFCLIAVLTVVWACSPVANEETETEMDAQAAIDPSDAGSVDELIGTKWAIDDFVLEFREGGEVHVSGDGVPIPGGVLGEYSVTEGVVEVSAAGQTHRGIWDGERLEMSGFEGEPVS